MRSIGEATSLCTSKIYEAFCAAIVRRNFTSGQRAPSSRSRAIELKTSRIPVLTAYSQLLAEGYFETRSGSGTFVQVPCPQMDVAPGRDGAASPKVRLAPILAHSDFRRPFVQLNAICHTRSRLNHHPPRNHICTNWSEVCAYQWFALS